MRMADLIGTKCENCLKKRVVGQDDRGAPVLICVALTEFRVKEEERCWARETSVARWVKTLKDILKYAKADKKYAPVEITTLLRRAEMRLNEEMSQQARSAFYEDSNRQHKPSKGEKSERSARKKWTRIAVIPWDEQ